MEIDFYLIETDLLDIENNFDLSKSLFLVLGSGIMGSGIACHLANVGLEVILLDIIPKNEESNSNKQTRNSLVNISLQNAIKSKPSPLFTN